MSNWQDWKTITISKKPQQVKHPIIEKPKEIDEETKIEKVSMTLSKQIQQARMKLNLTQKQLAQKINVKPDIVNSYENGKAMPDNNILQKLRKALGCKLNK